MLGLHVQTRSPELVGDDVHNTVPGLELAGDTEKGRGLGKNGVAVEDARPNDEVDETGLVFQRHERDSGRGSRTLAAEFARTLAAANTNLSS